MGGMEAEFHIVHVAYPLWFRLAILGTLVFVPVGIWLARRSFYPAAVCMAPIIANLGVVFVGLSRVAEGMSTYGGGRGAAAAGCAEAQIPLQLGTVAAFLLSGVLTLWPTRDSIVSVNQRRLMAITNVVIALFVAGEIWAVNWLIAPGRTFSQSPRDLLRSVGYAAAVLCLLTIVMGARRAPYSKGQHPSRIDALFVLVSAVVLFTIAYYFSRSLRLIALGI